MLVLGKGHQEMLLLKLQILEETMAILGWVTFVLITLSRIHKYGHRRRDFCIHTFPEQNSMFGIIISCILCDKWRLRNINIYSRWYLTVLIASKNPLLPSIQPQINLKGKSHIPLRLHSDLLTPHYPLFVLLFIRGNHLQVNNNIIQSNNYIFSQ